MSLAWTIGGQRCIVNNSTRTEVMRVFRHKPLRYLSLADLMRKTKLPAEVIVESIEELRAEGLHIGCRSPGEYFYEPHEEILHPDTVAAQLTTRWWGRQLLFGDELSSSIDIAKAILERDVDPHGIVVAANAQTKGRGRQGNIWISPKGKDILLTFLIRIDEWPPPPSLLSLYTVTAVARVLDTAYGIPITIKWPNDLMADGRKLGGVLVERDLQHNVILSSLGLNVHCKPCDWPETLRKQSVSLEMLTQEEIKRDTLIAQCGTTWEALWETLMADRGETVRGYWRYYSSTLGKRVHLLYRGQPATGSALDIDEVGRLLFRCDDGSTFALLAEEAQHLRVEE